MARVIFVQALGLALLMLGESARAVQPAPDGASLARRVREVIALEYKEPVRFNYIEQGRDVDISMLGKVSLGPLETFEVRQEPPGGAWRRLIAVDGKPLDPEELKRRDAEHRRDVERRRSETPQKRAARQRDDAEELRERDAILDDAERVFAFKVVARETIDGQSVMVVELTPRSDARVTTSDGERMKHFAGRVWVSEGDYRLARVQLRAVDAVSVGWGVVARVEAGSGFELVRKKVDGAWVASTLTIEGSGRTLLFRKFQIKTVTTYSDHRRHADSTPPVH